MKNPLTDLEKSKFLIKLDKQFCNRLKFSFIPSIDKEKYLVTCTIFSISFTAEQIRENINEDYFA